MMFADLLTLENDRLLDELLAPTPGLPETRAVASGHTPDMNETHEPDRMPAPGTADALRAACGFAVCRNTLAADIARTLAAGGIVRTWLMKRHPVGLCVVTPDDWASRESRTRTWRVQHLIATGRDADQTLVKSMLLRDLLRGIGGRSCLVARLPGSDRSGVNALLQSGFTLAQTALTMSCDLSTAAAETVSAAVPAGGYEVSRAEPAELETVLQATAGQVPAGIFGWDAQLPRAVSRRVYADWLRGYAAGNSLFVARDRGRAVGLLAERITARDRSGPFRMQRPLPDGAPARSHDRRTAPTGRVDLVATAPEYRTNGVVPRLMTEVLDRFRRHDVRYAQVSVCPTETALLDYCRHRGFETVDCSLIMTCRRN